MSVPNDKGGGRLPTQAVSPLDATARMGDPLAIKVTRMRETCKALRAELVTGGRAINPFNAKVISAVDALESVLSALVTPKLL